MSKHKDKVRIKFKNMEYFKSTLAVYNYSPSTIQRYVHCLKRSGVNLRDKRAVHRAVNKQNDLHGESFRAMMAYDRFLKNAKLPGGHEKRPSTLTTRDVCLRQNTRADVAKVYWLVTYRKYSPLTAASYVRLAKNDPMEDRHRNVYRATVALKDFDERVHCRIYDPVIRDFYNSLPL